MNKRNEKEKINLPQNEINHNLEKQFEKINFFLGVFVFFFLLLLRHT